jgi:hypothetical protein
LNIASTDQGKVIPAEEPEEQPLPSDPKAIFLGGLFVLALLAAAFVASDIVLPLVFAIVLKLLLQPALYQVPKRLTLSDFPDRGESDSNMANDGGLPWEERLRCGMILTPRHFGSWPRIAKTALKPGGYCR